MEAEAMRTALIRSAVHGHRVLHVGAAIGSAQEAMAAKATELGHSLAAAERFCAALEEEVAAAAGEAAPQGAEAGQPAVQVSRGGRRANGGDGGRFVTK